MNNPPAEYSYQELMAVIFARDLQDGEVGVAAYYPAPFAACLLAQRMHAPNLTFWSPSLFVNPKPNQLYSTGNDYRTLRGADAIADFYDVFEYSERGVDFFFYSGVQIDQFGNCNLHYVGGDLARPKFRATGIANISHAVMDKKFYIYTTAHTKRMFVPRVDFISVPGFVDGPGSRERLRMPGGGPSLCVTPLAALDFDAETKRMRLRSVHEWATPDEVVERTGFDLLVPGTIPTTPPPTPTELAILRTEIDPTGLLRE